MTTPTAVAIGILVVTYLLLFTDRFHSIHRASLSIAGAMAMILAGKYLGFYDAFPSDLNDTEALSALGAVDWNTLGLLLGMMIIVNLTEETGVFAYLAIRLAKYTGGSYWRLMLVLSWFTFVASALLDNVTAVIFISFITVSITSILNVNPIPLLISEAIMSNVGGMATLVGDPPNVIIGSAAGFSFLDFIVYLAPVAVVVGLATTAFFRWHYRGTVKRPPDNPEDLQALDAEQAITDRRKLTKLIVIFGLVIVMFFVHKQVHMEASEVAMLGAGLALLAVRPKVPDLLARIKWDVLLFFGGLFVMVGGLEAAGVLDQAAHAISDTIRNDPLLALLVVLWAAAILSAIVDNIPLTIAVAPILANLQSAEAPVFPIWWALAAGVAIGGCITPIGASANVYVMSIGERAGYPISFGRWLRVGIPVGLAQLIVASLVLYGMARLGVL